MDEEGPAAVGYPYLETWNDAFEKNPVGLLIEVSRGRKWRTLFTDFKRLINEGKTIFSTSVVINSRQFPECSSTQKKQAKKESAMLALKLCYFQTRCALDQFDARKQAEFCKTVGLSEQDVVNAEAYNQPYQETGSEDAFGVQLQPGDPNYVPPKEPEWQPPNQNYNPNYDPNYDPNYSGWYDQNYSGGYGDGSYEGGYQSFEGDYYDGNGGGYQEGEGYPIPQYGDYQKRHYSEEPDEEYIPTKKIRKVHVQKNAVSALLEYGQKTQQPVAFEVVAEGGKSHKPMFVMRAKLGSRTFINVETQGKKQGKVAAALVALRALENEGTYSDHGVDLYPVLPQFKEGVPDHGTQDSPMEVKAPGESTEDYSGSVPPSRDGESVAMGPETFKLIAKNPIQALMEYAQQRRLKASIDTIQERGPTHDATFVLAVWVGEREFPSIECRKKKYGKLLAADKALRILLSEGEYISQLSTGPAALSEISEEMTHFDKMAALSHKCFNGLLANLEINFPGRKVLAAIIMKQSDTDLGTVVALGSGNRCASGDKLSLEGTTVNDSHAEVAARRSFLRYLYKSLLGYDAGKEDQVFEPGTGGKLRVKEGITFHMYISSAPCGDGALFSPRDKSFKVLDADIDIENREHKPLFSSEVQGLLRTKVEGGEGTIPVENDKLPQTWDGIQRGERLRTMSCTDKICRWNVIGIQGALLSHFMEPVYLESVSIGFLYDHGHLSRALCCRLTQGDTPIQGLLPEGYRLNHPWLGRVTICQAPRDTFKTRQHALNWCLGDEEPEILDGTEGVTMPKSEEEPAQFSRLCKKLLFEQFKLLCEKEHQSSLVEGESYAKCKQNAVEYQDAKQQLFKVLHKNSYGTWVCKPIEEDLFYV